MYLMSSAIMRLRTITRVLFHIKYKLNKHKTNKATFSELIYKVCVIWRRLHLVQAHPALAQRWSCLNNTSDLAVSPTHGQQEPATLGWDIFPTVTALIPFYVTPAT